LKVPVVSDVVSAVYALGMRMTGGFITQKRYQLDYGEREAVIVVVEAVAEYAALRQLADWALVNGAPDHMACMLECARWGDSWAVEGREHPETCQRCKAKNKQAGLSI
jgi:hypothetical protein